MLDINNNLFGYIEKSSEMNDTIIQRYKNSLIFIGDEKQIYVPITNSYVGVGMSAINNIKNSIPSIDKIYIKDIANNSLANSYTTYYFPVISGTTPNAYYYTYVALNVGINPVSGKFIGGLQGTADYSTVSDLTYKTTTKSTNNNSSYYISFVNNINDESYTYVNNKLLYNPYEETLNSTYFVGDLKGHAETADYATYSTYTSYTTYALFNSYQSVHSINNNSKYCITFSKNLAYSLSYIDGEFYYNPALNSAYAGHFFGIFHGNVDNADTVDGFHVNDLFKDFRNGDNNCAYIEIGDVEKYLQLNSYTLGGKTKEELFTNFSTEANQTTSITIGDTTKKLKIDAYKILVTEKSNNTTYPILFTNSNNLNNSNFAYTNTCISINPYYKSFAQGNNVSANAPCAHAEGTNTIAGDYAHAEGSSTKASGDTSHAEGYLSEAQGQFSHAEGQNVRAKNICSHAEGVNTEAGPYAHAEGSSTKASGDTSHAEGYLSEAQGQFSHAEGSTNIALGWCSHVGGNGSTSSGDQSFAHGSNVIASGWASFAVNANTTASGLCSFVCGQDTQALHNYEFATGHFNLSNSDTIFSVGGGNSNNNRFNLFEVTTSGKVKARDGFYKYNSNNTYILLGGGDHKLLTSLFTNFSNAGNQITSITIGDTTKTLAIDAATLDGFNASDLFQSFSGGTISSNGNYLTQSNHTIKIGNTEKSAGASSNVKIINSAEWSYIDSTTYTTTSYNLVLRYKVNGIESSYAYIPKIYAYSASYIDGLTPTELFTNFSNAGNQITSITIGGTTKTLAIDAAKLDGFNASDLFQTFSGGTISSNGNYLTQSNHTIKIGNTEKSAGASNNVKIINAHTASGGQLTSNTNIMSLSEHTDTVNGITSTISKSSAQIINSLSVSTLSSTNATNLTVAITINDVVSANKTITDLIARQIAQTSISSLSSFTNDNNLIYAAAGGDNSVSDKPTNVDAFGVLSFKTAAGWYGQLLMSSNEATGLYWRTATTLSGGWNKLLDSSNYTNYTVTKTGTGATGTWEINITGSAGSASEATKLTTAHNINGTLFDGTADITTTNWGTARNISIADNDSTNTGTAVSVNGSTAVKLKLPSTIKATLTGNASTATKFVNARTIWGQSFDGTANVSGNMSSVGNIIPSGNNGQNLGSSGNRWAKLYIGTADSYGSATKGIYWDAGVPKACTVAINSGTTNKIAYYSDNNTISSWTSTIGETVQPIYLKDGVPTALSGSAGGTATPVYLNEGTITKLTETRGSSTQPVYLKNGELVQCTIDPEDRKVYQEYTSTDSWRGVLLTHLVDDHINESCTDTVAATNKFALQSSTGRMNLCGDIYIEKHTTSGIYKNIHGISIDATHYTNGSMISFGIGTGDQITYRGIYDDTTSTWLIYGNGTNTILPYGNIGIGTTSPTEKLYVNGYVYATGFKTSMNSAEYCLTSNGGHKRWVANAKTASTIVARDSSGNIFANWISTTAENLNSTDFAKVYVAANNSDVIKYVTKDKFLEAINDYDTLTFTKTLKVTEAWMDTGITTGDANTSNTINKGNGTYAVQISHGTLPSSAVGTTATGADSWPAIYSGIMSIYHSTNGSLTDEIILHRSGHAGGKRLYLRILQTSSSSGYSKIQIAAESDFEANASLTFKFRKLI